MMATSFKRSHACTATLSAPDPAAGHQCPTPLLETPGHYWASLGQSLVRSLLLSAGSRCAQGSVCVLPESISPSYISSGSSMVGLMVTSSKRAYAMPKSAAPSCSRPLLTRTSTGHAHTQFCLSLCGVPGFWCEQHLFEPSERLWRERGLILNVNSPLLPSCFLDEGYLLGCSSTAPLAAH